MGLVDGIFVAGDGNEDIADGRGLLDFRRGIKHIRVGQVRKPSTGHQHPAGTGIDVSRDGDVIKLNLPDGVTFDFGKADLKSQFYPALNNVAATLREYNQTIVEVSGHTDSIGSDAVNQRLSEQRASAVGNYLIGQGLQRERFEIVGMGKRYPVASNDTDAGRAMNRRVEVRVLPVRS